MTRTQISDPGPMDTMVILNLEAGTLFCLFWGFMSESTFFQSCQDDFLSSCDEPVIRSECMLLAQGYNTLTPVSSNKQPNYPEFKALPTEPLRSG